MKADAIMKQVAPVQESLRKGRSETPKMVETWSIATEDSAVAAQATDVCDSTSIESAPRPAAGCAADLSACGEFSLRAFDIITSIMVLLVVWPLMLVTALLIRVTSHGPVIYQQRRVGRHHKIFTLYKFRTMVDGAERDTGPVWASAQDCRVTLVGRTLRRTRIDELPQLFNVLRGDMSLVGPRPERPCFVTRYEALQGARLAVKPGITGLAQIRRNYDLRPDRKLRYDVLYIHNRSMLLNVCILVGTVSVVFRRKGW
jgi:lipopolysaccharide/colanic/teichoic acid biosynthesis glycosyltransferase